MKEVLRPMLARGLQRGMTSIDIGFSESGTTPVGQSLQLGIDQEGVNYEEFTWSSPTTATPGACNGTQQLPVELSYFSATTTLTGVEINWRTESEIENLGFVLERKIADLEWAEIASYKSDDALLGQGTVSSATDYKFVDVLVQQGFAYEYRLSDIDYDGVITSHATRSVNIEKEPIPSIVENFNVMAYPNPFNPVTTIRYSIKSNNTDVAIAIYDITGNLVKTLVHKQQTSGWYEVQWNGTNQIGSKVPGGVYLSRVVVGNQVKTNKLILLK